MINAFDFMLRGVLGFLGFYCFVLGLFVSHVSGVLYFVCLFLTVQN